MEYTGGSGRSRDDAVIILGATTTWQGVQAERAWLDRHFPGFIKRRQLLTGYNRFDVISIETCRGEEMEFWSGTWMWVVTYHRRFGLRQEDLTAYR